MPDHHVAIFGGAVSGAEAAHQFSQKGIRVTVFDQNPLPYGKIEDGLPKWHVRLRDKEEGKINEKLSHELVDFVPYVRLGRDVDFLDVVNNWGFSAVLLATGAWRDRPLPIAGIDDYLQKGFAYQNRFIYWYNHKHEPDFKGASYTIGDNAIIVGGGLASLDVAKVFMFETVEKALTERGLETNLFALDRSIAKVLDGFGLTLDDLGIKGCTLFYRRRIKDMPLSPVKPTSPEHLIKVEGIREKILNNYKNKYLFNIKPLHVPVDKIVENGRLTGLVFQQTELVDGKVRAIEGSEKEYRGSMIVSSIGSVPEQINGIPLDGQIYRVIWEDCCRIDGFDNVFALGNAVTGRGNINESLKHGRQISQSVIDAYLEGGEAMKADPLRNTESVVQHQVDNISQKIISSEKVSPEQEQALAERIQSFQKKAGYTGDFMAWVEKHMPDRLENMLGIDH